MGVLRKFSCWLAAAAALLCGPAATAQEAWEYSPYRIHVWLAFDDDGSLTPGLARTIRRRVIDGAGVVAFSAWEVDVSPVPDQHLRQDMLRSLDQLVENEVFSLAGLSTVKQLEPGKPPPKKTDKTEDEPQWPTSANPDPLREMLTKRDKVVLAAIRFDGLAYQVLVRELDTATRQLGLIQTRETRQRETLPDLVFDLAVASFRPLVRLVSIKNKDVTGKVRAAGLFVNESSPCRVDVQDALVPVVRTNDRLGQPKEINGIRFADWSYLQVTELDAVDATMKLHTALRNPLGGRSGSRVSKYGLKIQAHAAASTVRFVSRNRGRPLSGYEIISRHPDDENQSHNLGLTNWNGEIEIPAEGDTPLRLVYIKNGGFPLARVPVVPGYLPEKSAEMRDDEPRLAAEAFIRSIQNTILDTVAQRQMLTSRIEKHLQQGELAEAKQLLQRFRSLSTLTEITALMDRSKKNMSSPDRRMQNDIDAMFQDTRELAVKYLGAEAENVLNNKVLKAERGGSS